MPVAATVKEVQLYIRSDDPKQTWAEAHVQPGEEVGQARFADEFSERPEDAVAKQVCQRFSNWSRDKSRFARIIVKYAL